MQQPQNLKVKFSNQSNYFSDIYLPSGLENHKCIIMQSGYKNRLDNKLFKFLSDFRVFMKLKLWYF